MLAVAVAAFLGLGILTPGGARAETVVGADFDQALGGAVAATTTAAQVGLIASCRHGEGTLSTLRVSGSSVSVTVIDGAVTVKALLQPDSWTLPMNGVLRGYRERSRAAILSSAGVPATVRYVSGPWGGWASRYSSPGGTSSEGMRDFLLQSVLSMGEEPWGTRPYTTFERDARDDGTTAWSAEQLTPDGARARVLAVIDEQSHLVSQEVTREEPGLSPETVTCTMTDVGQPAALDAPVAAEVGPLRRLGPAAWRISTLESARDAALRIRREAIREGGDVRNIREQSRVVVQAMGMQDWKVATISGGVRLSLSDPWGGTVARCIKKTVRGVAITDCA